LLLGKSMKKILFVNGGNKGFGTDFIQACQNQDMYCVPVRLRNMVFIFDNDIRILHHGNQIDFENIDYCFIRVRGKYQHTSAILTRILFF